MRYIIIFLIGFFLGGMFGGDLGLLFQKTKNLVLREKTEESQPVPSIQRQPEPVIVRSSKPPAVTKSVPPPVKKPVKKVVKHVDQREKVYTVQVASFRRRNQAKQYVDKLIKQEYDAYIAPAQSSKVSKWYRVCIGETISLEQAKAMNTRLKPKFKDSFVHSF